MDRADGAVFVFFRRITADANGTNRKTVGIHDGGLHSRQILKLFVRQRGPDGLNKAGQPRRGRFG